MSSLQSSTRTALAEKYRQETGLNPNLGTNRLILTEQYLAEHGLAIDDIRFEDHVDRYWDVRRNRSDAERDAVCVGSTSSRIHGWTVSRIWVVPVRPLQEVTR